jgi:hypothetical protein
MLVPGCIGLAAIHLEMDARMCRGYVATAIPSH